ncbi:hypothetical protein [Litoreibacter janthinus]|uniref:hypothetical protein n=1 Tax=Litoreibacter janthinus TaxID=670154 RepID=UPI000B7CB91D|nr:hypothetical protein [Litoreibacter janthinus]
MALLSQQLNSVLPLPLKPVTPPAAVRAQSPDTPLLAPPASQARVKAVAPAATAIASLFPADTPTASALRDRQEHELQALLRNMQGIEPPRPIGERVDLLVPRPSLPDPNPT